MPVRPARTAVRVRLAAGWAAVAFTILLAFGIAIYYALHATSWAVMTDELQVVRLAESIADHLSPVPYIHDSYYGALSQLYPLLLAPFFGVLSAPEAATAAHAFNAVLLPSAAWPAYLLARSVTGSRRAAAAAAALTAFTPWLVLTSTLLTENAAYPAFVWAVYLCHRTLVTPSPRNDALALAGLLLAFFARTQLLVLAVALPVVVLLHAWPPRRALRAHPLLGGAFGTALLTSGALLVSGSLGVVVGNYAEPFSGDLMPKGLWSAGASHLVHVVVGAGVVPFVLAVAWTLLNVARPQRPEAHAFAALSAVLIPLLTLEVASFDLRFTPDGFKQDRYLFYLVPLLAVGTAAALVSRRRLRELASCSTLVFALFAWLLLQYPAYDDETVVFWAAPAAAFHTALPGEPMLVVLAAIAVCATLSLLWRAPRAALPVVAACISAFGIAQALYVFERYAEPTMARASKIAPRDWIDRVVPGGASVALVPAPRDTPEWWWEAELWNKQADRVLRVNGGPTFSPFPVDAVAVDFKRGRLRGAEPSNFLVLSAAERRFHPLELQRLVDDRSLKLVRVGRPYRLDWATRGVTSDGWTIPGQPATMRFYGHGVPGRRRIEVVLAASKSAALPLRFTLRTPGDSRSGSVDPAGARPPVQVYGCVPPFGALDLTLTTRGSVRIPDGRLVGLHLDSISIAPENVPCKPRQLSSR